MTTCNVVIQNIGQTIEILKIGIIRKTRHLSELLQKNSSPVGAPTEKTRHLSELVTKNSSPVGTPLRNGEEMTWMKGHDSLLHCSDFQKAFGKLLRMRRRPPKKFCVGRKLLESTARLISSNCLLKLQVIWTHGIEKCRGVFHDLLYFNTERRRTKPLDKIPRGSNVGCPYLGATSSMSPSLSLRKGKGTSSPPR